MQLLSHVLLAVCLQLLDQHSGAAQELASSPSKGKHCCSPAVMLRVSYALAVPLHQHTIEYRYGDFAPYA
jgi:hypothetical protein